ncbi:hypothetical protein GNI_043020 [Gregarina niphandrodes]|uniref:Uncharacterized protein n=1 Tax=Gregarina niphandrodes TaxID=110365 RepID=A0A023B9Z6_GRENI|nr:hypothetical protein GNI_043020 [Gregarina niphandrodes]EZG77188.1 hypothetical protein GNI_043020 [Gregarina niphandrodes]|eukprot:XP_011129524.1 hypothetical protein GNI_043020 [Gregarina niphandrodes]
MVVKLGGAFCNIREINTSAELQRYFNDFTIYNVAVDFTDPDHPQVYMHHTPGELCHALIQMLPTLSEQARIYLHDYSEFELNEMVRDENTAQVQLDIMRLRAKILGLIKDDKK